MNLWTIVGIMILGFIALTLYACLVVGSRADDQMEAMLQSEQQKDMSN